MPPGQILAHGTDDPLADAATQAGCPEVPFERPEGDWDLVERELMTFADPARELPPIDRLEGFRPEGSSLYRRVLVAIQCGPGSVAAWTYEGVGLREYGGRVMLWPDGPTA